MVFRWDFKKTVVSKFLSKAWAGRKMLIQNICNSHLAIPSIPIYIYSMVNTKQQVQWPSNWQPNIRRGLKTSHVSRPYTGKIIQHQQKYTGLGSRTRWNPILCIQSFFITQHQQKYKGLSSRTRWNPILCIQSFFTIYTCILCC